MNTKGLSEFLAENWKMLAGVLAAALLALAVAGLWNHRRMEREMQATNFLYEAQSKARSLAAEKKLKEAEQAILPVLEKFPKTRAAYEASLQIGDLWMDSGAFAEAMKYYEMAGGLAKDSFSKLLASYSLGIARETAGQYQEAVASYGDALQVEGSDYLRPEILMAQARCFEALKQVAKAMEIYQQVQKDFASRSYYSGAAAAFEKQLAAQGVAP